MSHVAINSFLDSPVKNVLSDGQLDSLLALRICIGPSLFDVLSSVVNRGIQSYIDDNLQTDFTKYLDSCINPELPW